MKPRNRSLTGAVIAVLVLPVFAGLLACMPSFPVPIGNPEKSRIDSDISGMWIMSDGSQTMIHLYVPYDKRTWLLTTYGIEIDEEWCSDEDFETAEDLLTYDQIIVNFEGKPDSCFEVHGFWIAKAWLTKLGGERFITMELKNYYDEDLGYEVDEWLVHRVDLKSPDELRLRWLGADQGGFGKLDKTKATRRQYEKIIRKQPDNPGFYDEDPYDFHRVKSEDTEIFADLIGRLFDI